MTAERKNAEEHFMGALCSGPQNRNIIENTSNATAIIFHFIFSALLPSLGSSLLDYVFFLTLSSSQETGFSVLWLNLPITHLLYIGFFYGSILNLSSHSSRFYANNCKYRCRHWHRKSRHTHEITLCSRMEDTHSDGPLSKNTLVCYGLKVF